MTKEKLIIIVNSTLYLILKEINLLKNYYYIITQLAVIPRNFLDFLPSPEALAA